MSQNTSNGSNAVEQPERFGPALERWLALGLAFWVWSALAQERQAAVADAESQAKVTHLLQTIIQDYWNAGEAKSVGPTNELANSTNVEAAFRAASKLMPNRLDLRFGIASSLVLQALQTNGPQLELKIKEALKVYQEIQELDPNGFEAPIWYAAYTRALGDTNASAAAIRALMAVYPERTTECLEEFDRIDRILRIIPNEKPVRMMMPKEKQKHLAIVVLGAGLETNGALKVKLETRLRQGLQLARMYRHSPIILTGGNQKGGVTEAYVMSQWYVRKGISRKRLFLEDKARDTVENALFSAAIIQKLGVTHVTVVTSATHIRRGLADLEEACLQRALRLEYGNLAAKAKGEAQLDNEQEWVSVYRDVMRTSGLWSFPAMRR